MSTTTDTTTAYYHPLSVYICLGIYNIIASIIQGVAGFGDAIVLHVFWFSSCLLLPDTFGHTALGPNPVRAVTILMYARVIFSAPLLAYWLLKDGLFSKTMVIMMAIPSTTLAVLGVFVFRTVKGDGLKYVLGISSLVFAICYVLIIGVRYFKKKWKLQALARKRKKQQAAEAGAAAAGGGGAGAATTTPPEDAEDATADDVHVMAEDQFVDEELHQSFGAAPLPAVGGRPPAPRRGSHPSGSQHSGSGSSHHLSGPPSLQQGEEAAEEKKSAGGSTRAEHVHSSDSTPTPRSAGYHGDDDDDEDDEVCTVVSTMGGSPFHKREAAAKRIAEDNVPPLSPGKLSPLGTMTYTRVRVNRNLDENGKIKMSTKLGAAFFSALSGIMGSLTGVGGPAQIIFILLFDVPSYVITVNFVLQSIPSALFRFVVACWMPIFTKEMIPLLAVSLLCGYVGIYVGSMLGKLLGPKSYSWFVLNLLVVSSLIMLVSSAWVLIVYTLLSVSCNVMYGYYEFRENQPRVASQAAKEQQLLALEAQKEQEEGEPQQQPLHTSTNTNNSAVKRAQLDGENSRNFSEADLTPRNNNNNNDLSKGKTQKATEITIHNNNNNNDNDKNNVLDRQEKREKQRPPPLWANSQHLNSYHHHKMASEDVRAVRRANLEEEELPPV